MLSLVGVFKKKFYYCSVFLLSMILSFFLVQVVHADISDIPVAVDIGLTAPINNHAVSSGVPFPMGQVSDVSVLRLLDSTDNPIAAQFTKMVAWPDGSLKVALVSFIPTVASNGTAYNAYKIRYQNTGSIANPTPTNSVTVTDNGSEKVVDTGVATFYISKSNFTVFNQIKIGGVSQMQSPGDIIFVDNLTNNTFKTSLATNYSLSVVESGPIKTAFLLTGRAKAVSGNNTFGENTLVTVKLWMTFYANSGRADLKYTWIDDVPRANGQNHWGQQHFLELKSNSLDLPLTPTTSSYAFGGVNTTYTGAVTGTNYLLQDAIVADSEVTQGYANGYQYQFTYSGVSSSTATVPTGSKDGTGKTTTDFVNGRAPGWLDVARGSVGVTAGIKDFWQEFPNKLSVNDQGLLQIFVQPPESSNIMYTSAPGVGKTHDIFLDFHAGTDSSLASKKFSLFQEGPLLYTDAAWYAQTKVFGPISSPDANSVTWDAQVDNQFTCSLNRTNCSIYDIAYGKRNFGDYIMGNHGYMYANQHYEDAHGWILQYLRLGRKKYFNWSASYAKHHYDLDVMHTTWNEYLPGYPAGLIHWHGGSDHEISGLEDGHTVPGGIDEYYLLTGDPRALDVSREQGDWMVYHMGSGHTRIVPDTAGDQVAGVEYERTQAWPLYTVLKTFESTGDLKYWNAATIALQNTIDWWKYPAAIVQFAPGVSATANITNGSTTIVMPDSNWRWYMDKNYTIAGNGIPAGTTISSVVNDVTAKTTTITMSNAATADGTGVAITINANINTSQSVQSQALYYEPLDWTKGNGYFVSTFKTDNTTYTNLPVNSSPSTWVYQNHIPISWMGAYLISDIIRYLEDLKTFGGSYNADISYRGSSKHYAIDSPTVKEMIVQTVDVLATHNFNGYPEYPSVYPWMSTLGNHVWVYSASPERVLYNITSGDGAAQIGWPLMYASQFQPSELLQPSLWTAQWSQLQTKWQAIAKLSVDPTSTSLVMPGSNTGYQGASVFWNMPFTMSMMGSVSLLNGSCGSANNQSFPSVPTSNLCINGSSSGVTGGGPWNWTCVGSNGGTTANCSANSTTNVSRGKYSISNFVALLSNWLHYETGNISDLNSDGIVDARDLGIMFSKWK